MNINNKENSEKGSKGTIIFGLEATKTFVNSIEKLSMAVSKTMGPSGSYVLLDQGYDRVRVTKDGVTVAKALSSSDKFENMAIQLIKEVCIKSNSIVGDGTTTSIVILSGIITEGYKRLSAGYSAKHLIRGIEKASLEIEKIIQSQSFEPTNEDVKNVATISADNDEVLGALIHEAVKKINGKYGLITVEEGKSTDTELEFTEGLKIAKGYMSPYFVSQGSSTVEYDDVLIFMTNGKISQQEFILKCLEHAAISNKALLIICDDIDKQILNTLIINCYKGIVKVIAIKAPEFGEARLAALSDIALITGGKVVDENALETISSLDSSMLGSCRRIIVGKDSTSIIDGYGDKAQIQEKISNLQKEIDDKKDEISSYELGKLQDSYSKLTGGVAIIKVGGSTESELSEKKDRVIDSVSAVKATYDNGVSMGGGLAAFNAARTYSNSGLLDKLDEKEKEGAKILIEALKSPMRQILQNGNFDYQVIMHTIEKSADDEYGFDAHRGEYCNLRKSGILDSTKSVLTSLSVSVSIGKVALNSQVMYSSDKKDDN